jgi:hypothetical protein
MAVPLPNPLNASCGAKLPVTLVVVVRSAAAPGLKVTLV